MGISILGGDAGNYVAGSFSVLSGDIHVKDENTLAGEVNAVGGLFNGTQVYYASLEGNLSTIEGYLWARNGGSIEGELLTLDTPIEGALIGASNGIALEGELFIPTGSLTAGGELVSELSPVEGEFTSSVPSIGTIDLISPLIEGEFTAGGELIITSVTLTGDLHAIVPVSGSINALSELQVLEGALSGLVPLTCAITGALRLPIGNLTGHTDNTSRVQGTLVTLTGSLTGLTEVNADLTGELKMISGQLTGVLSTVGNITGDLRTLKATPGFKGAETYGYQVLRFIRGETR